MTLSGNNTLSRWPTDRHLLWLLHGVAAIAGAIVLLIVTFLVMSQDRKRFHDPECHDQQHDRSRDRGGSVQQPEQEPVSRPAGQSIVA